MIASPPPVPEHEIWGRSLRGALSQAQHLCLEQVRLLAEGSDPALRKVALRVREALTDGDAEGLSYAGSLLDKAGSAAAAARRALVVQYECRTDPKRPPKGAPRAYPIHQLVQPPEWPVWVRFLNVKGEPVSGPIWVDEATPPPHAQEAPLPLSDEEFQRLRARAAKQAERAETGPHFVTRSRALTEALEEIRGAREEWDLILRGLAGNPAGLLLQGQRLPARLDRALSLLEEVARADEGGRRPGRPAGELGKTRARLEARKDELKADYLAGMPYQPDLELKYGTSHVTLRAFVKEQGWPMREVRQAVRRPEPVPVEVEAPPPPPVAKVLPAKAAPVKKPAVKRKAKKR